MTSEPTISHKVFEKLFQDYRSRCTVIAYSYVRDMETARDIVNDSFLFLWENKENIEMLNLEAYIYKVIRNKCMQYRRDFRLHREVHEK